MHYLLTIAIILTVIALVLWVYLLQRIKAWIILTDVENLLTAVDIMEHPQRVKFLVYLLDFRNSFFHKNGMGYNLISIHHYCIDKDIGPGSKIYDLVAKDVKALQANELYHEHNKSNFYEIASGIFWKSYLSALSSETNWDKFYPIIKTLKNDLEDKALFTKYYGLIVGDESLEDEYERLMNLTSRLLTKISLGSL